MESFLRIFSFAVLVAAAVFSIVCIFSLFKVSAKEMPSCNDVNELENELIRRGLERSNKHDLHKKKTR